MTSLTYVELGIADGMIPPHLAVNDETKEKLQLGR